MHAISLLLVLALLCSFSPASARAGLSSLFPGSRVSITAAASTGAKGKCSKSKTSTTSSSKLQSSPISLLKTFAHEFTQTVISSKTHLKAGAAARGISIFLLYPLDTIKTRLQMSPQVRATMPPLLLKNVFRGVFGSLAGQIPYGMLTFGSYEVYKAKLIEAFPEKRKEGLYVLAAIMGDLTGSFWLCPSEVVKQQLQGGMHATLPSAVAAIFKKGGLGGFYRGYVGQIMRDVPFRAVQLPSYEIVKLAYIKRFATTYSNTNTKSGNTKSGNTKSGNTKTNTRSVVSVRALRPLENMLIGIVAGTFSAAVTTPLDVIKTRLMTSEGAVTLTGALNAASTIYRAEGARGLFSGLGPRVIYVGPSVGVFFVVYEGVKAHLATVDADAAAASASASASKRR